MDPGSPAPTPLSALGAAGGVGFPALEAARARTARACDVARGALAGMPRDADVAVVLLGSWGRGELTSGSDDDVLVVTTGARRPGLRPAMHELLPAFGGPSGAQGTFDDVVSVQELATIGLQEDSNRVLTRRMLVLLESAPLLGADVHRRVLATLLDAYLGGERRDRRPPRFLLNDVVRYWRTVAVDFEAKARAGDDGKWALRHAKLRTSRTMLFAGGLLPLLECHHVTADDAPALLLAELLQPPTDRIAAAFLRYEAVDAGVRTLGAYDRFLGLLDDPAQRAALETLPRAHAREDATFQECRRLGREIQQGLTALLFEREPLRRLVRQYGVLQRCRCSTVRPVASLTVPAHRFTPDDVLAMVQAGIIGEDERVELVDGVLVEMNALGPDHEDAKEWLVRFFSRDAELAVRVGSMLLTDDGYVLPDLQVAQAFPRKTLSRFAPLVVEIAQSSHRRDREKAAAYARAGVPEYWIIDVVAELVVVHRAPSGDAYTEVVEHREGTLESLLTTPPLALDALFARS